MITVEEAIKSIETHVKQGVEVRMPLSDALGMVLSQDIISSVDMPPFQQSSMDGYAIKFNETKSFKRIGEIKTGDEHQPVLKPGDALRIFTGAPVPLTADAVAKQEDVILKNGSLLINPLPLKNENIRPLGQQTKKGVKILYNGHEMNPASLGFLSGLGIKKVMVYKRPKICLLITGNELVKPGETLAFGQVYESNAPMLLSALKQNGFENVDVFYIKDNYLETLSLLKECLKKNDVLICSGGISVGDHDYIGKALEVMDINKVFYKVKQKPGKPLYFGTQNKKLIFALPGNPAATLTCFYVYVLKALNRMMGKEASGLLKNQKQLTNDYGLEIPRAQFLKAAVSENEVTILEGQSSAMLHTFALSNALVYKPMNSGVFKKGQWVETLIIKS